MRRWIFWALGALLVVQVGCHEELEGSLPGAEQPPGDGFIDGDGFVDGPNNAPNNAVNNDAPNNDTPDDAGGPDDGTPDAGPDTPDTGTPDAAEEPDVPPDPCAGVACGAGGRCQEGQCVCDAGFVLQNNACVAEDPGNPALRSAALVCQRWTQDYAARSREIWRRLDPNDPCDAGEIVPEAHEDAMRRLNLFRWLVGLQPAGVNDGNQRAAQQAAMMMDVNNSLSHTPPSNWQCFNQTGASAAGQSNLALGYNSPADTVDGYLTDDRTPSLGHRRWCIFPQLDNVGFGHRGRGGAQWVFSRNNRPNPQFVAFPSPGPYPIDAIRGVWSFSAPRLSNPTVRITNLTSGQEIPVQVSVLQRNFGMDTIAMAHNAQVGANTSWRVEVTDGAQSWSYETTFVSCR